jgi:hypothetical protein
VNPIARTMELQVSAAEARAIARDAYVYGFPLVDNYRIQHAFFVDRNHPEYKGGRNAIHHTPRVQAPRDRAIQAPNPDTACSVLGADLRGEPLVLAVPMVDTDRYYSLQFVDLHTYNIDYVGSRSTGNGPGIFMLVGPGWRGRAPAGIKKVIACETDFALVIYRMQIHSPRDLPNVRRLQAGFKVQTLSEYLGASAPPPPPAIEFIPPLAPREERTSPEFFNVLNFVLRHCRTHASETALMERFAKLGIGPGHAFDEKSLARDIRDGIEDGIVDAWRDYEVVEKQIASGERECSDLYGGRQRLDGDYLTRMVGAVDGIYGNSKEEATYDCYNLDADGGELDGSVHRYTLRFGPGQMPPVNAFWSLALYASPSRHLVENRLDRYVIDSAMVDSLRTDPDGGVTLRIQHESPGPEEEPNWLPAPEGPFSLVLRLYWPRSQAFEFWKRPPVRRFD